MTEQNQQHDATVSLRDEMMALAKQTTNEVTNEPDLQGQKEGQEAQVVQESAEQPTEPVVQEEVAEVATEEAVEEVAQEVSAKEEDVLNILNDFSKEEREVFDELLNSDDEGKSLAANILAERYKKMKAGFTRKTQELSEKGKEYSKLDEVFNPIEANLKAQGIDKSQFVQAMMNDFDRLNKEPANVVKELINRYKLDAKQLGLDNYDDYDYSDKSQDKSVQQNTNLSDEEKQRNVYKITQFAEATNSEGKLIHPHFDKVRGTMGDLIARQPNLTMKQAYDKALLLDGIEEVKQESKTNNIDELAVDTKALRKRIGQAKKASKSLKSSSQKTNLNSLSIREELAKRAGLA